MKRPARNDLLQKLLLSVWAFFTMVLLFCVVLLVNQMLESGHSPLGAIQTAVAGGANPEPQPRAASISDTREVALYFATEDALMLAPEMRTMEYSTSIVVNCRKALEQLIAGPRDALSPVITNTVKINGVYLIENGELVLDFSSELRAEHTRLKSASLEALLVYGIVNTLSQETLQTEAAKVRSVRFLIDGAPPAEIFPAHFDLSRPVFPNPNWIQPAEERTAANG